MPEPDDIPPASVSELRSRLESKLNSTPSRLPPQPFSTPATPVQLYHPALPSKDGIKKASPPLPPPLSKRAASCHERPPLAPKPRLRSPERPQQLLVPIPPERRSSLLLDGKNKEESENNAALKTSVRTAAAHFDILISSGKLARPGIFHAEVNSNDPSTDNLCPPSPTPGVNDAGSWNEEFSDSSESSDFDSPDPTPVCDTLCPESYDELPLERERQKASTFSGRKLPPEMIEELKKLGSFRATNLNIPRGSNGHLQNNNVEPSDIPSDIGRMRSPVTRKGREVCSETLERKVEDSSAVNFRPNSDANNLKRPAGLSFSRGSDASIATLSSASSRQSDNIVYNTGDAAEDTRLKKLHYAAQEIYTVEKKFVEELQLIAVDYPNFLIEYGRKHALNLLVPGADGQPHIVSQITTQLLMIKGAHVLLLEKFSSKMKNWNSQEPNMAECLKNNAQFLKFCLPYLKEKKKFAGELMKQLQEDDELSTATTKFEERTSTRISILQRLDIVHQNVVRYTILMESYKKYLPQGCHEHKECEEAIKELAKVSESVNQQMTLAEMEKRLLDLYRRLEGKFNVFEANRHLLHEGELMKQSRKELQQRYLILFSDTLLICKYSRGPSLSADSFQPDFYQLPILSVRVKAEEHGEFETHFQLLSTKKSAVFIARTKRDRDDWVKRLTTAKGEARKLRFNTASRRKKVTTTPSIPESSSPVIPEPVSPLANTAHVSEKDPSDNEMSSPAYLPVSEKYAAPWIPDPKATTCMMVGCGTKFSVFNRRHHCRRCGWLICRSCVGYAPVKNGSRYVRDKVCPECFFHISEKWSGVYDMTFFLAPSGGVRRKLQLPSRNDEGIVSGTVFIRTKKTNENQKWGRLVRHEDGVMVLQIYDAEFDMQPCERHVLMGFKVQETDLEEGGRLFELRHANQIGGGNAISIAFRVAHSGNAERWSRALEDGLQAFNQS